jgi:hypothetical protein
MKIIFLDFDGVLLNRESFRHASGMKAKAAPSCVKALNRIIEQTGADIVVSSTWRIGNTVKKLAKILKGFGVRGRVVGKTPNLDRVKGRVYTAVDRGEEIKKFIGRCKVECVILDDDSWEMNGLQDRFVKTKFNDGLTEALADKAIKILGERNR